MAAPVSGLHCIGPYKGAARGCDGCRTLPPGALRPCARVIAESPAMRAVLGRAASIARSDAPVVVLGETGTGKEVLARAIHASGPRAARPFVALNCGAMPAELMESELFGHVRGAFSGAVGDKTGLFEAAGGGTLLLDEVADLPLQLQVKLLRVLQDGHVRRVGATRSVAVDLRVIAATHRPLRQLVERGEFREDLYYRLVVFQIVLPPLRDRAEDVLPLARDILATVSAGAKTFGADAERALLAHRWPGNVRELVNAVRHGAALAREGFVGLADLPEEIAASAAVTRLPGVPARAPQAQAVVLRPLAEVERDHILAVVRACGGNHAEAARVLGIARTTLWRKLEAYREADRAAATPPSGPGLSAG
jgi:DNA-binding NtrC family response regulator